MTPISPATTMESSLPRLALRSRLRSARDRQHLWQQTRCNPGVALDREMDAVPGVVLAGDHRVEHDHLDVARAQPVGHRRDIGGALVMRDEEALVIPARLQ